MEAWLHCNRNPRTRPEQRASGWPHHPSALPLAMQNIGLYSPMSWVIIGGLITSTLLARLVTPVMYKLIPPSIAASPVSGGTLAAPAGLAPTPATRLED